VLWEDPLQRLKLVTAEVIEVHSIKLAELGVDKIKGKSFSLTVRWTMKK
jgi:hypothetical protein